MTIDQVKCDVVMEGVLDDVMNAKQDVYDALRKFSHTRHCKAEAEIIKDQVQWFLKVLYHIQSNFIGSILDRFNNMNGSNSF